MEIQKIESISLLVDNTFSRSVFNVPTPQTESSKIPWFKTPESEKEKAPQLSEAAVRLSKLDQQMDQIEKTVSSVREELTTVRRTLPPFPPGSEERVRMLKSYIGLRKLIEQLTIPPEEDPEKFKEGMNIPELSGQATNKEWDAALVALDKAAETIRQKKTSLETGTKTESVLA